VRLQLCFDGPAGTLSGRQCPSGRGVAFTRVELPAADAAAGAPRGGAGGASPVVLVKPKGRGKKARAAAEAEARAQQQQQQIAARNSSPAVKAFAVIAAALDAAARAAEAERQAARSELAVAMSLAMEAGTGGGHVDHEALIKAMRRVVETTGSVAPHAAGAGAGAGGPGSAPAAATAAAAAAPNAPPARGKNPKHPKRAREAAAVAAEKVGRGGSGTTTSAGAEADAADAAALCAARVQLAALVARALPEGSCDGWREKRALLELKPFVLGDAGSTPAALIPHASGGGGGGGGRCPVESSSPHSARLTDSWLAEAPLSSWTDNWGPLKTATVLVPKPPKRLASRGDGSSSSSSSSSSGGGGGGGAAVSTKAKNLKVKTPKAKTPCAEASAAEASAAEEPTAGGELAVAGDVAAEAGEKEDVWRWGGNSGIDMWCEPPAWATFDIRGPTYLVDKKKEPSPAPCVFKRAPRTRCALPPFSSVAPAKNALEALPVRFVDLLNVCPSRMPFSALRVD